MLWDLVDIIVQIFRALFWLLFAWCLVTKGFLYCFVVLLITYPVWKVVLALLYIWDTALDEKRHPEKYRNRRIELD